MNDDVKSELGREERLARQQLQTDADLFRGLIKHPGWERLKALVETAGQNQYQIIMRPLATMDSALVAEHAKGALMGLSLAVQLPSAKIKEAADLNPGNEE